MIDQLITALSKEVEMSAEEIADTIWLALQMQEFQAESVSSGFPIKKEDERGINKQESHSQQGTLPNTSDLEKTSTQPPEEQKAGIYPRNQQHTSKSLDLSFKVPDARSLREPLTLARALKPLMRRIPSGRELVLDEAATIQRIVDEGLWIPVLKPTVEPWLDLELVVDEAISMQIWRHTIRELERLLKNYGIFRDVRVWGLITDENEQVQIRRGIGATAKNQTPRSPKELIDPSGRRLVLVVSDCVSSLWRNGAVTPVLELWAKQGSMAIVQMLPKWLWKRTALGRASEVRLRGLTPGVFNQKLIAKEVSLWDELEEETGVKVPVFTLEPDKVVTWAQMVSGKGSIWTLGYLFKLDTTPVNKESGLFNLTHSELSAEQRVQAFRVTASPMARKLAGLLASAPVISVPIVRLIREALLKDAQQVHVAEVFLGGLLKPISEINADTNPDYVRYEFMDEVRELLVDSVPSEYVLNVVDEVSKYVATKAGLSLEAFAAILRNPQEVRDSEIADNVAAFAMVTAQVLRRLGGEYVKVAEELELNNFAKVKKSITNLSISEKFQHGYVLLIGVGECQYKPLSLPVTVKDTQAIYTTLVDPELCAYPDDPEHIRVLNNERATRYGILEGLQWLKDKAEADSEATVLIYYSGHGWVDKTDNRYYFVPHDSKPYKLVASALSAEEFTEGLQQIKSQRLLVIIDAAHSGKMVTSRNSEEADVELLNEFDNLQSIAPYEKLISSLKQWKVKAVFASCKGDQMSYIKDDSISIYTFHLLEALRGTANQPGDTTVKISDLVKYLGNTVPKTAQTLHNVKQTPYFQVDTEDFAIAKLRGGKGLPDVPLLSEKGIDYIQLRKLLIAQNWREADKETARVMLQASGQEKRGWLDEENIKKFPLTDLQTIDQLWLKYSNGHFGFSVQKKNWQELGEQVNIETERKLGKQLGWFNLDQSWLDYSNFTFSLDTPEGHLPANWDCEGIDGQEAASTCLLMSRLLEHDENQQIDYTQLRNLLAENKWREADKETLRVMLKATNREKEGTLDYQAIKNAPCIDLNTIDQLWTNASKQRFGFSIQLKKWQEAGGKSNTETEYKLGNDIGWYVDKKWLSDISKFTFHLSAPVGHLPVEWTFHLGGIFPRKEESVLFSDLANRLLSCNINNLKIEPQISESNIETSQMTHSEHLQQILTRVEKGQQTDEDITFLRQLLLAGDRQFVQQLGKYNVNVGEGKEIHIGDRIYNQWDKQAIQALIEFIKNQFDSIPLLPKELPQQEYISLKNLLGSGRWREANDTTKIIIVKTVKREQEGWLTDDNIQNFPPQVLQVIDRLWLQYSNQRFGFSVQKRIFNECEKNPQAFGDRVGWRIQETWISSSQIIVNPTHAPEGHLPWGIMQVVTMDNAALNAFVHGLRNTTKTIMQQDWQKQLLADFMAFGGFLTGDKVDKEEFKRNLEYELSHDQAWWEGGRLEELKVRKLFSLLTTCLNL